MGFSDRWRDESLGPGFAPRQGVVTSMGLNHEGGVA